MKVLDILMLGTEEAAEKKIKSEEKGKEKTPEPPAKPVAKVKQPDVKPAPIPKTTGPPKPKPKSIISTKKK